MLEAKHLRKEYKEKNGPVVKALDDVSIKFEETGMVFILGKSGSGKSTLLNVLGGLDKYDSGEVIVKGKSSKDFSQADFDSYRNTFIGFIFQEYNILEEYTVSKNIALALELQGKKADKKAIEELIEQVDLKGYGARRPNTLSGGQKQRVAIARALVKNPQIIMADEPTGALDSNTGKQVFDTLKKLSKTKLVLIVSHDRDFAEYYGDRVIELADGKIISDVSKYKSAPVSNDGFEIVDDKVLTIKKQTKFDKEMAKNLLEFVTNHKEEEIIVSVDSKANDEFKKFAHIDSEGNKESFKVTDEILLPAYNPKDFKLIRSRLPNKDSLKLGASGLKSKPVRLVFTIILSAIAFGLFGLADTLGSYNKVDNTIQSISDSKINYASFSKEIEVDHGDYTSTAQARLSNKDLNKIKENLTELNFIPVYGFNYGGSESYQNNLYSTDFDGYNTLYKAQIYGGIELTIENQNVVGSMLAGSIPSSDNEIVITKYMYEVIKEAGYKDYSGGAKVTISTPEDLINQKLHILNKDFKIVGIIDTNLDLSRYSAMKEKEFGSSLTDYMSIKEVDGLLQTSYHSVGYFNDGYMQSLLTGDRTYSKLESVYISGSLATAKPSKDSGSDNNNISYIGRYDNELNSSIVWLDGEKTSLADDEVIISSTWMNGLYIEIDGARISASSVISGGNYRDKLYRSRMRRLLSSLDLDENDTWNISNYYGKFDTTTYEYNDDDSITPWYNESSTEISTYDKAFITPSKMFYLSDGYATNIVNSWSSMPIIRTFSTGTHTYTISGESEVRDENGNYYYTSHYDGDVYVFTDDITYYVDYVTGDVTNSSNATHYQVTCYFVDTYDHDKVYTIDFANNTVSDGSGNYTISSYKTFSGSFEASSYDSFTYIYDEANPTVTNVAIRAAVYPVSANKFTNSQGVEFTIDLVNGLVKYNSKQLEYIRSGGSDLSDEQKATISEFFENYTNPSIPTMDSLITSASDFMTLYEARKAMSTDEAARWSDADSYKWALSSYISYGNDITNSCSNCAPFTDDEIAFMNGIKVQLVNSLREYFPKKLWIRKDYNEDFVAYTVVGVHTGTVNPQDNYSKGILATKFYDDFEKFTGGVYSFAIAPMDSNNTSLIRKVVEFNYADQGNGVSYNLRNTVMTTVEQINGLIETMTKVFLYVGIGFAVFASLLLLNFITISISYKKREIGVLRAIGARGLDVFKIFFSESFIIAFINFLLAFGTCLGVCIYLNSMIRSQYGILITLLNVGIRQVLLMFGVSVLVAFISSFLPVFRIARKRPIDAIRDN